MLDITRCEVCGSQNIKNDRISLDHMGKVVKQVPVIICQDCGEVMVTSDVLERVENLTTSDYLE